MSISIAYAQKVQGEKSFVVYCIRYEDVEVKRRFSEFDSLRSALVALYPASLVPPLPEKHSLSDYQKAKQLEIVEKRKRLLALYLNRIKEHKVLGQSPLFQQFLDPSVRWAEVASNPPVSTIKGSFGFQTSGVKMLEERFVESETFTKHFANAFKAMDKAHMTSIKKLREVSADELELGALYNGFSLTEDSNSGLSNAIETLGTVMEESAKITNTLLGHMDGVSDVIHDYNQYADVVKNALRFRLSKQAALEHVHEQIATKQQHLAKLIEMEEKAKMEHEAIQAGTAETSASTSPSIIKAIGNAVNNLIDSDPELTRKTNMDRTRERIEKLKEQGKELEQEVKTLSDELQKELNDFQIQKEKELKDMIREYARIHAEWCKSNVQAWKRLKEQVQKISIQDTAQIS